MKIKYLEIHNFAPELNKAFFKSGQSIRIPGIFKIKEVKEKFFSPIKKGKIAKIIVENKEYPFLNKVYHGYIENYKEVKDFLKELKIIHNVKNTTFTVKTYLRG